MQIIWSVLSEHFPSSGKENTPDPDESDGEQVPTMCSILYAHTYNMPHACLSGVHYVTAYVCRPTCNM